MTTNDFHKYADETLETLTNELEELVEKHPEGLDFDISLAVGTQACLCTSIHPHVSSHVVERRAYS
jgi:frataxin-like iron-binding protein CyaY